MTKNRRYLAGGALLLAIAGLGWHGFAGPPPTRETQTSSDSDMPLSGEQLWSMNCRRCHNIQPPTRYSDAQWEVIVHHMRIRANITGAEQRAIVEFLKSAN